MDIRGFDRRAFMKWAAALPLLSSIAAKEAYGHVLKAVGKPGSEDIYRRIGVRPLINARGTWTYLSGSLELPEVQSAQQAAALHFVDIVELQHAVGRRLAELSGAESQSAPGKEKPAADHLDDPAIRPERHCRQAAARDFKRGPQAPRCGGLLRQPLQTLSLDTQITNSKPG